MFGEVGCLLLLVPSECIHRDETGTEILLTLDTDTGRFYVISDGKLTIFNALSVSIPNIGKLWKSLWGLLTKRVPTKRSS